MRLRPNPFTRWLLPALCCCCALLGDVARGEWQIFRHEGRDYVSIDGIAEFYGFPAPAKLEVAAATPAAPAAPTATPAAVIAPNLAAPVPVPGRTVALDNGKWQLAFTVNGRETEINGVKQWLAFPTLVQEGKLLVSRLDLSKTIEPRLRPEKIEGLRPVKTIVLDPGHGGVDRGAISRYGNEKDFALDVATRARELLEKRGFNVVMTRTADIFIPLHERPAVANKLSDAIFVSIHFNSTSSNPDARGFEIYSVAPRGAPATNDSAVSARDLREEPANVVDTQSAALAGSVFHSLLGNVPLQDRGIKHARFAVLRLCTQPAVLVECGFVSNSSESALIGSPAWRQKVAESIAMGIDGYKGLAEQRQPPKMVAEYRRAPSPLPGAVGGSVPPAPAPPQ